MPTQAQGTLFSIPLIACYREAHETCLVGEEAPLAQQMFPDLTLTVILTASGGGSLRLHTRATTALPPHRLPIGTLFITLDELTKLCSGEELPFSFRQSTPADQGEDAMSS